ncbi:MAG: diguanylate cyclase [Sphaerochaetaceae bacterium]|nr:diguanylate cyclase [Sphaerochaetaceae bacterium]MDD4397856.1 diguanylate cyclase [Sphaerochaetaceae bacterium]
MNDEFGHKVGDTLIQNAAKQISLAFQNMGYRIGGDEFVIMTFGLPENEFTEKMQSVKAAMNKQKISISIGEAWQSTDCDLSELLKIADGKMYQEKRRYYQSDEGNQYGQGKRYI